LLRSLAISSYKPKLKLFKVTIFQKASSLRGVLAEMIMNMSIEVFLGGFVLTILAAIIGIAVGIPLYRKWSKEEQGE